MYDRTRFPEEVLREAAEVMRRQAPLSEKDQRIAICHRVVPFSSKTVPYL